MAWDPNSETRNTGQDPDAGYGALGPSSDPANAYFRPPYNDPAYQQSYGYTPPPEKEIPLPLGEAIRQLPRQYLKVITHPSENTFAQEMGKAAWNIIWVQLIGWAVIVSLLGILGNVISPLESNVGTNLSAGTGQIITLVDIATSYGQLVLIPALFFIWTGLLFLFAKAFGGRGTFLAQSYMTLLIDVPLSIISSIFGLIPLFGAVVAIAVFIYNVVLQVFALRAVHGLSRGKAIGAVLSLLAALFVILCPLSIALALYYELSLLH